jgi:hypothetical protein
MRQKFRDGHPINHRVLAWRRATFDNRLSHGHEAKELLLMLYKSLIL